MYVSHRADLRRDGAPPSADYMMLMNADVDAYLNREEEAKADLGLAGLEEDENANMVSSLLTCGSTQSSAIVTRSSQPGYSYEVL